MESVYDALLFLSFGGPEGMDDVMPFLENVLRGRNVPPERMKAVAHHYEMFGGVSPINQQNRQLIEALKVELATNEPNLPIYWGNRNWHPMLADTIQEMADDGIKNALCFVTSAYGSQSSCRQYLDNIEDARAKVENAPHIHKLRLYFNHPGFIESNAENLKIALQKIPGDRLGKCKVAFTAHSIPTAMADNCLYVQQLEEASRLVADICEVKDFNIVYQSRSGPPTQPWLEPDIVDFIAGIAGDGYKDLVVLPIGFISDHMEVIYDLDTEAQKASQELGLNMVRAATVGCHPKFVSMIRALIMEKVSAFEAHSCGTMGLLPEQCSTSCCPKLERPKMERPTMERPA